MEQLKSLKVCCLLMSLLTAVSAETYATPYATWTTPGLYINLQTGVSYSTDASISVPSVFWDPSPEGYGNRLGNSEILGVGIGYIMNPMTKVEINVDHRSSYTYQKFLSTPTSVVWGPRTRYFKLNNTSIMANAIFNASGFCNQLYFHSDNFIVDPFVGVGMGVSFNTLDNLHSVQTSTGRTFSMMSSPNTRLSFAYQVSTGIDIKFNNRFAVTTGYRYYNGGNFKSNNYIVDNPDNPGVTSGVTVPPWNGRLGAHELFLSLHYLLG